MTMTSKADACRTILCVMQFATEAAITILRIDDMITVEKGPDDEMDG